MAIPDAITVGAGDKATAAVNTAVVITYAAKQYGRHALASINLSYNAAPTGGNVKVEDGAGTTVFELDITAAGPCSIMFNNPMVLSENKAMLITLAAAGAAVTGKLNVQHYVM